MLGFSRNRMSKLLLTVAFSLAVFVIQQLSYAESFALAGQLSESIKIVNRCTPNALEPPNTIHPIIDSEIPNIVHQLWKTANLQEYSTKVKASHEACKSIFEPHNYTVKLWTDDDVLKLIKAKYAWLLPTYMGYPYNIQRADIARLRIVYTEGGIYADLDVFPRSVKQIQCLQYLGLQAIFSPTAGTLGLSNHFFMAERGSPILQWVLYEVKRRASIATDSYAVPTGLLVYGVDDVDGCVQGIRLDIRHAT